MPDTFTTLISYALSGSLPKEAGSLTVGEAEYDTCKKQAVLGIPADVLGSVQIDPELKKQWLADVAMNIMTYYHMLDVAERITEVLKPLGIIPVIVKGIAAAQYYPRPECRMMGDIDFLIRPYSEENFAAAEQALVQAGFDSKGILDGERHLHLSYEGIELEMHRFFSHRENESQKRLDEMLASGETVKLQVEGRSFWTYAQTETGLILLYHAAHHLAEGLGLRHVIDWLRYAEKTITDEYWDQTFEAAAAGIGLCRLARILTHIGEMYYGIEGRAYSGEADPELTRRLYEHVLDNGNFGAGKAYGTNRTKLILSTKNKFSRLQAGGLVHWQAARKHAILRPFAWIYQLGRGAKMVAHSKSLRADIAEQRHDDELYRELEVGRYQR